MTALELERRLEDAHAQLAAGSRALLAMTAPTDGWCAPFCKAANLLEELDISNLTVGERKRVEEKLRTVQMISGSADTLLDSAAALYFGCVLIHGSFKCGYLPDGEAVNASGGSLTIHG